MLPPPDIFLVGHSQHRGAPRKVPRTGGGRSNGFSLRRTVPSGDMYGLESASPHAEVRRAVDVCLTPGSETDLPCQAHSAQLPVHVDRVATAFSLTTLAEPPYPLSRGLLDIRSYSIGCAAFRRTPLSRGARHAIVEA